jgi:alkylation response protein AidB-like acyl-CoA dehydrogenase
MQPTYSPDAEAYRDKVHAFLAEKLPADWGGIGRLDGDALSEFVTWWRGVLYEAGYLAPGWPLEYGGGGLTALEQVIIAEEFARAGVPTGGTNDVFGIQMLGNTLLQWGTDEQKQRYLPRVLSGEDVWCQGYSEPNAGSDLGSLALRAVLDGDQWVLNGQKIWTSAGHLADHIFTLARTDPDAPKHKGITYFMTPMDAPGISVRPLVNMADEHVFNEIVFDNVRIPVKYRVGEENRGWYIGMTTLDFERSNISTAAGYRRSFEQLVGYVKENGTNGKDDGLNAKLADLAIENQVGRYLSYRVASMQDRGQIPNYESSAAKVYHSEYGQRLAGAGVQIMGLYGILDEESKHARLRGRFGRTYLTSIGSTIAAGTSEIQRGIIAQRGLGLSRI